MCGIVGMLSAQEERALTQKERQLMREEALALEAVLEHKDPSRLVDTLQAIADRVYPLPSFATSFALGQDPSLREDFERLKTSLRLALETVSWDSKTARNFSNWSNGMS